MSRWTLAAASAAALPALFLATAVLIDQLEPSAGAFVTNSAGCRSRGVAAHLLMSNDKNSVPFFVTPSEAIAAIKEEVVSVFSESVTDDNDDNGTDEEEEESKMESIPFTEKEEQRLSIEERISASVTSTVDTVLTSRQPFIAARESLNDAKKKAQKRLSRTAFEKGKAEEKIARIVAKFEDQCLDIEKELAEKNDETQVSMDAKVELMSDLLCSEIKLETRREEQVVEFLDSLQVSIAEQVTEIESTEQLTIKMTQVRSKMGNGGDSTIVKNLDRTLAQRTKVSEVDQQVLSLLTTGLDNMTLLLDDVKSRSDRTMDALESLSAVAQQSSSSGDDDENEKENDSVDTSTTNDNDDDPSDWSENVQEVIVAINTAIQNMAESEKMMVDLNSSIDKALLEKLALLESNPEKTTKNVENKKKDAAAAAATVAKLLNKMKGNQTKDN